MATILVMTAIASTGTAVGATSTNKKICTISVRVNHDFVTKASLTVLKRAGDAKARTREVLGERVRKAFDRLVRIPARALCSLLPAGAGFGARDHVSPQRVVLRFAIQRQGPPALLLRSHSVEGIAVAA